jgi:hypothetical protein
MASQGANVSSATTGCALSSPKDSNRQQRSSRPATPPASPKTRFDAPSTGSARSPARKASTGTLNKGAGNDPLMHRVLEWIRSTRIGGFEDCTKVAKIARAANLQSSLPSCNLRKRPRCIATTRYDRNNPEDRRNPLDQPSVNRFQATRHSSRTHRQFFFGCHPRDRRGSPSLGVVALATAAVASA